MQTTIKSYTDKLALRWVENFISTFHCDPKLLPNAIAGRFPGRISNICFHEDGRLKSFLYWSIDQKEARKDLKE